MQVKLFNIPISDTGQAIEEMNKFLRSHKVIELQQELVNNNNGAVWCFCARYILNASPETTTIKRKTDYKNVLGGESFKIFTQLREIRKQIAKEEAIPAYAVLTDEEMAEIARLKSIELSTIKTVKGIGEKKTEKYGAKIIELFNKTRQNETDRKPDTTHC